MAARHIVDHQQHVEVVGILTADDETFAKGRAGFGIHAMASISFFRFKVEGREPADSD